MRPFFKGRARASHPGTPQGTPKGRPKPPGGRPAPGGQRSGRGPNLRPGHAPHTAVGTAGAHAQRAAGLQHGRPQAQAHGAGAGGEVHLRDVLHRLQPAGQVGGGTAPLRLPGASRGAGCRRAAPRPGPLPGCPRSGDAAAPLPLAARARGAQCTKQTQAELWLPRAPPLLPPALLGAAGGDAAGRGSNAPVSRGKSRLYGSRC